MAAPMAPRNPDADRIPDHYFLQPLAFETEYDNDTTHALLTYGYVRKYDRLNILYARIDIGIVNIILKFVLSTVRKFGVFDENKFKLLQNGTVIKGAGNDCSGYLVFAECDHQSFKTGYFKGVHFWTLKAHRIGCYMNVGVLRSAFVGDQKEAVRVQRSQWELLNSSCIGKGRFQNNDILTIVLDCDQWIVKYYVQCEDNGTYGTVQLMKRDKIKPNESYYFALLLCAMGNQSDDTNSNSVIECIETPIEAITAHPNKELPRHKWFTDH
eukprot:139585_1